VEIIERTTRQGADVVRRIQSFAGARRVGEPERVDLNQVVEDVVEMTRVRWRDGALAHGVTIDVQCELPPIPPVWGQVVALREVVTNLVLNSADALPYGGRIVIRTSATDGDVTVSVIDNGIGMTPDVLRRAQEPFFTTKGVKSTGLGLSVNYGIVKQHGGQVTIVSAVGKGTTVIVRLPAADVAAMPPVAPVAVKSLRVLLVDDEADVRSALGDLLEDAGHVVAGAADGAEAIARLEAGPVPDVLLTDHGMPGMTGAELADIVHRRWPDLAVGLITGWGDEPHSVSQARPDFILSKPVHVDRLMEAIGRALAHRADAPVQS
jgi:CheY-like chemotaxis protein